MATDSLFYLPATIGGRKQNTRLSSLKVCKLVDILQTFSACKTYHIVFVCFFRENNLFSIEDKVSPGDYAAFQSKLMHH